MRARLSFSSLIVAVAVMASAAGADAQAVNSSRGGTIGPSGVILSPGMPQQNSGTTTSPAPSVAPRTTTGTTGSRASTALPGDNPSAPGFPGPVGK